MAFQGGLPLVWQNQQPCLSFEPGHKQFHLHIGGEVMNCAVWKPSLTRRTMADVCLDLLSDCVLELFVRHSQFENAGQK